MANPTTNYGFVLPTATDLVTDLPADFDVALQGVDTRLKALQPGTTLGDLAYSSATANTNTRLPIGTNGQVLAVVAGVPAWQNGTTGDIEGVTAGVGISGGGTSGTVTVTNSMATAIDAKGDLVPGTGADTFSRLAVGANGTVLTADSAETTGLKWATPASGSTFSGCFAYSSTDQTIANGTNTFLLWNSESFDVDGYHSTSSNTSRFTIPTGKTGYFLWSMNINWGNSATGVRTVEFFKNGTKIVSGTGLDSVVDSDGLCFQSPSVVIQLSAGDYVETRVSQSSGGNLDVRNASFVSIVYLGA